MEPLIHFIVPFVALMLYGVEGRKALPISLLALLPDMDVFFHVHRSLSHSLVVLLLMGLPLLLLAYRLKVFHICLLGMLVTASHTAMDVFAGFTPILWPLYGNSIWIQAELRGHMASFPSVMPALKLVMRPTRFTVFQSLDASIITGEGLIISMMLLLPIIARTFSESRSKGANV